MKKALVLAIIFSMIVTLFSGCGSASSLNSNLDEPEPTTKSFYTDESGNFIRNDEDGVSISAAVLPCSIPHNNANITVSSVNVYQDLIEDYYAYTVYVVVELDVSELDEAQIHWLRESDISTTVFLTNEKNEYDNYQMSRLGNLLVEDTSKIYYVFTSSAYKDNRYDFSGSDMTVFFTFTQEKTYLYNDSERHCENYFRYNFTMPENSPSAETIPEPLYSYIAEWLGNQADFYGSLIN